MTSYDGPVYDLTTVPDHNFFAGGVLVHNCDPGLQPPMLGLISEREIAGHELPPGVRILGACNPSHLAANGHDISPPLANRFGWLSWGVPTVDEHREYMMGRANGLAVTTRDSEAEERRVLEAWPEAFAWAVGVEGGFLQAQADAKNRMPKDGASQGRAWPSDRTWTMATQALASSRVHGLSEVVRDEFVAAFIGAPTHQAWMTWFESADLPSAADLLDGKKVNWKPDGKRLDRAAAVLSSCTALLLNDSDAKRQAKRADNAWKLVLAPLAEVAPDIVVPSSQQMIRAKLTGYESAIKPLARLAPIADALRNIR